MTTVISKAHKDITGIIRIRAIPPEWTEADYIRYWKHMPECERDRYTVYVKHNTVTSAGRTAIETYIATNFVQILSFSNQAISGTSPADTSMAGEYFRKAFTLATVTGTQTDISTYLTASDGISGGVNTTVLHVGLWGNGATTTLASGSLYTHALTNFTKTTTQPISLDYLLQTYWS